jgi:exodeoxyribonuclease VII small subunit
MSEEIKFEKAMERLEKIVTDLEAGNVSLDDALKKYEEGVELSRACQKKLVRAEKKIEILTKTLNGSLKREPFTPDHSEDDGLPESSKKAGKKERRRPSDDDDDGKDKDLLI